MEPALKITVTYFAALREQRGLSVETITTDAASAVELYRELTKRHNLAVDEALVRVARHNAFVPMSTQLRDGDHIVFMPPVAGG
jgi:molybdopterin converting factor small subunit